MLDQKIFFEHRDLVAVAALGDDHELVRHARRRRQGLPAAPAVAARAAPGRADPAGRPAGGHLLLDRLRLGGAGAGRLRCGRLAGGRRGARSGRSGRGAVGLVGSGRRGAPTASGRGLRGSVGVGFGLVPLGVDRVDHRSLVDLGRVGRGRPPASAAAATAPPPLLRGCGRSAVRRGLGLGWFRLGVAAGRLHGARSLRRLIVGDRGRGRSGGPASAGLPRALLRLRPRGVVRLQRRLPGAVVVGQPAGRCGRRLAGSVVRGSRRRAGCGPAPAASASAAPTAPRRGRSARCLLGRRCGGAVPLIGGGRHGRRSALDVDVVVHVVLPSLDARGRVPERLLSEHSR